MQLTDTHTHLYVEQFDEDRTAVINRALTAGVTRFFIPAIDLKTSPKCRPEIRLTTMTVLLG